MDTESKGKFTEKIRSDVNVGDISKMRDIVLRGGFTCLPNNEHIQLMPWSDTSSKITIFVCSSSKSAVERRILLDNTISELRLLGEANGVQLSVLDMREEMVKHTVSRKGFDHAFNMAAWKRYRIKSMCYLFIYCLLTRF